ncbi:AEC family transporter [Halopseudomonas sp. SMJS2]|uniref:AEC family transporter n=1 Tax=Halopseudomonas sp. SMJS2 TaxID=3041098 RepID=UPI00044F305A|nr:AEC family transporter [Halopseudomonas sp. SMJS2]EZQ20094.1 transporter [Halopseudomonas bauzanensis]WGK60133.1 AEC family transporter [Halopseudomonas sp. SMJS2]
MVVLNALVPVFGLIFLGWFLGARRVIPAEGHATLGIITFKLFMPVLLFSGLAKADLAEALSPLLLMRYYLPAFVVFIVVNLLVHRRLGRPSSMGLAASYSNNVLVGIPLITVMLGAESLVYLFAVLAFHSLLLFTLQSIYNAFWGGKGEERIDWRGLLASLANPLIIGLFLGGLVNLAGIPIPGPLWHIVEMLAAAALPTALLMLGLSLASYRLYLSGTMALLTAAKLVVFPLLVLGMGWLMPGLTTEARTVLVLMAACPTGINVLAFAMGREDMRILGSVIFLSTVMAAITLPVWLLVLAR